MIGTPLDVRRALSVTAAASLLVGLMHSYGTTGTSIRLDLLRAAGYVVVLGLAAAAVAVPATRLRVVDHATLGTAIVLALARFHGPGLTALSGTDEHILGLLAMRTLLAGGNPYTHTYPQVGANGYGTPLIGGGQADTYGYPPLQLEIGRLLGVFSHGLAVPAYVDALALVGLGVAMYVMVPFSVRPLAVITVFGLDVLVSVSMTGLPSVLALALLAVPFYRWTSTGAGGRLGRLGIVQAVGLGLAASAQQLTWFVAAFLVLGLFLLRRGTLGGRCALGLVARYLSVAIATFALVDLPFIVADPGSWVRAMTTTLTQNAVVEGIGFVSPLVELNGGTGRLAWLSYAAALLLLGLLVVFALGFRRLAPAVAVLPWIAFLFSTRSNPQYIFVFLPLFVLAAVHADRDDIAASAPLQLPRRVRALRHRTAVRLLTVAVVLAPAAAAFAAGVTGQPPLTVSPVGVTLTGSSIDDVVVDVTNHTGRSLTPQYFVDVVDSITYPWVPARGPRTIAPHSEVRLVLRTRTAAQPAPVIAGLWIYSTVDGPPGMSATRLALTPDQVTVRGLRASSARRQAYRQCLARLLAGRGSRC